MAGRLFALTGRSVRFPRLFGFFLVRCFLCLIWANNRRFTCVIIKPVFPSPASVVNCSTSVNFANYERSPMKKSDVLKRHPYKITPPSERCKMYSTHIRLENGERRCIRSMTERGLIKKLASHYERTRTLQEAHDDWAESRKEQGLAPETLRRDEQRWDRYFKNTAQADKLVSKISYEDIEKHVYGLMKEYKICPKELAELLRLLRKAFDFAVRGDYISVSPMARVEINKSGCAPVTPKISKSRVYLSEEMDRISREFREFRRSDPKDTANLAVEFLFMTGLRIGELVALHETDVDWVLCTVHIQRTEVKGENGGVTVANHLKKKSEYANRIIPIGVEGRDLLRAVAAFNSEHGLKDGDYLFIGQHGTRMHSGCVDKCIRLLCEKADIVPAKSAHDIRRTVATRLYRNTRDIELVRKFMGHRDVQTTWGYIVDVDEEAADNQRIVNALHGILPPSWSALAPGSKPNAFPWSASQSSASGGPVVLVLPPGTEIR